MKRREPALLRLRHTSSDHAKIRHAHIDLTSCLMQGNQRSAHMIPMAVGDEDIHRQIRDLSDLFTESLFVLQRIDQRRPAGAKVQIRIDIRALTAIRQVHRFVELINYIRNLCYGNCHNRSPFFCVISLHQIQYYNNTLRSSLRRGNAPMEQDEIYVAPVSQIRW